MSCAFMASLMRSATRTGAGRRGDLGSSADTQPVLPAAGTGWCGHVCFAGLGAFFVAVYAFFAILFNGRWPRGAFDFLLGTFRWAYRVVAYIRSGWTTGARSCSGCSRSRICSWPPSSAGDARPALEPPRERVRVLPGRSLSTARLGLTPEPAAGLLALTMWLTIR